MTQAHRLIILALVQEKCQLYYLSFVSNVVSEDGFCLQGLG